MWEREADKRLAELRTDPLVWCVRPMLFEARAETGARQRRVSRTGVQVIADAAIMRRRGRGLDLRLADKILYASDTANQRRVIDPVRSYLGMPETDGMPGLLDRPPIVRAVGAARRAQTIGRVLTSVLPNVDADDVLHRVPRRSASSRACAADAEELAS